MASAPEKRLRFATLGPAGSNHEFVLAKYLAALGVEAEPVLFATFDDAFQALAAGEVDHLLQVAVHPSVAAGVGANLGEIHLIDSFLTSSQPMAVLTRADRPRPRSLGLMPATADYVDTSRWRDTTLEPSTVDVWHGLEAGRYDSGLTLRRFLDAAPDRYRLDWEIGAVTDAWLVYGRTALPSPEQTIRRDSPGARLLRGER